MKTKSRNPFMLLRMLPLALLLLTLVPLGLAGCGKRGDAEKAGEKVDKAIEDTKDGAKDMIDKDGPLENAGEKVDKKLDNN